MANSLTAFNPEIWRAKMQENFFKESVALGVAGLDLRDELSVGDQLHQPYAGYPRVQTYTKGTDITVKDINSTDDYISVATAKVASFYVDDVDKIQSKYSIVSEFASMAQRQLNNNIDQAIMSHYSDAGTALDDGDIGGTSGSGIVMDVANAPSIFTAAGRALNHKKQLSPDRYALIGPRMLETLQNYIGGRETTFGEQVSMNGYVGSRFGFKLYMTNNLPFTATWTPANNPSEGQTVTINGVTFTFNATPSGAGSVDIGSDTATSIDNLVACINDSGTAGTTYIQLSDDNRQLLEECGIVATDGTTNMTLAGYGDVALATSVAADPWSSQTQYALMGIRGGISLIAQKRPNVEFRKAQVRLGRYVHPWTLYGKGVFERNKNSLVSVQFDISNWV